MNRLPLPSPLPAPVPAPQPGEHLVLVSHALCPYVQRAVIALHEKGVRFERIDIDLAHKPEWFLALNPLGKTPVLLVPREGHAGPVFVPVFESAVICDYLDETIPPALHPADALQRAGHRAWIEVASATLNQIWQYYTAKDSDALELKRQELVQRFAQIDRALGAGPWFDGARFSLVDAAFAPVFRYFEVFDRFAPAQVFAASPRVRRWADGLAQRASVRAAVGAAYPALLRAFVEQQGGELGRLSIEARAPAAEATP
jgi:glutathione S-transferase